MYSNGGKVSLLLVFKLEQLNCGRRARTRHRQATITIFRSPFCNSGIEPVPHNWPRKYSVRLGQSRVTAVLTTRGRQKPLPWLYFGLRWLLALLLLLVIPILQATQHNISVYSTPLIALGSIVSGVPGVLRVSTPSCGVGLWRPSSSVCDKFGIWVCAGVASNVYHSNTVSQIHPGHKCSGANQRTA